jgi:hypothetical protein
VIESIGDRRAPSGIANAGEHPWRFIHEQVSVLGGKSDLGAIEGHPIRLRIDLLAGSRGNTVDADPPFGDELIRFAPGGYAGAR